MKNLILRFLVFATITLSFVSCRKEVVYPTDQIHNQIPSSSDNNQSLSRWGKYVLIGAHKYVTNTYTGEQIRYNDFGNGSRSSLRWGGSLYDIEVLIKDTTTWSFYSPEKWSGYVGDGKFVLNDDTTKYYLIHYTSSYTTIIEDHNHNQQNMGGSSRPFTGETVNYKNGVIHIYIQNGYVTLNGDACEYFTELKFKKIEEW